MREFEILPDEAAIKKMAMEYNRVKARKKLLERCGALGRASESNAVGAKSTSASKRYFRVLRPPAASASCAEALEKIYFLATDITVALRCLMSKSLNPQTSALIARVLRSKEKNLEQIAYMYNKMRNYTVNYAPKLNCNYDFCGVLSKINYMQNELLCLISEAFWQFCPRERAVLGAVWQSELSAAYSISYMRGFCQR